MSEEREYLTPAEEYAVGPPVGRRTFASEHSPSPPNGFPTTEVETIPKDDLLTIVANHTFGGLGRCSCGENWLCSTRLRATAELRRRGIEKPIREET